MAHDHIAFQERFPLSILACISLPFSFFVVTVPVMGVNCTFAGTVWTLLLHDDQNLIRAEYPSQKNRWEIPSASIQTRSPLWLPASRIGLGFINHLHIQWQWQIENLTNYHFGWLS
ncbi:hypothetical protein [Desulforhabdus amnigena]|jgi:hypothetical protein|uniref:hypothetical protein n=1 Tax=Desulforhabdus amnigena TaxID=40218 RepID=UPI0016976168|nr:hypothetical protein [Desulforhabdus amnigena]NLJ29977.1 hypothetical protein [Deltaproteobacteria bacterium]